ncbi:hypothetical protein M5D96_000319, partial [Drosophila gunungcola]
GSYSFSSQLTLELFGAWEQKAATVEAAALHSSSFEACGKLFRTNQTEETATATTGRRQATTAFWCHFAANAK